MAVEFYPFILDYKPMDYIWGGNKLVSQYGKKDGRIAESWELSIGDKHISTILNGEFSGQSLKDVLDKYPQAVGQNGYGTIFPLLVKLIDAEKTLSIQVHPGDEYALEKEGKLGKREMWYICEADENAEIYLGLNRDTTKEELREYIRTGKIEKLLNCVKVKKGDAYFVKEGTLHAIKGGVVILEIQENSDITYRVYDYDRVGADGKKRELHIEKAVDVADLEKLAAAVSGEKREKTGYGSRRILVRDEFFTAEEYIVDGSAEIENINGFITFTVTEGSGEANGFKLVKGNTVFVPAGIKTVVKGKLNFVASAAGVLK